MVKGNGIGLTPKLPESLEFRLLLKLTHPAPTTEPSEIVSTLQNELFDHKHFLRMVKWHRITPQVYQRLSPLQNDLPADFFQHLKTINMQCRMESLRQSTWLARISRHLKSQQIDFIALKGIALSKLLYGDSSYRQIHDIDIMVAPAQINATECILIELGFTRKIPHATATPKQIRFLNRYKKDRIYYHPDDGILLELHRRLTDTEHPFCPSLQDLLATGASTHIHDEAVPTVSGDLLWLYQCLHGAYSGWYRLRWICDIALLLTYHQPDWPSLLQLAERYDCKNSLTEGVVVASALYDLQIPDDVQYYLNKNPRITQQAKLCFTYLYSMQILRGWTSLKRVWFWAPPKSFFKHLLTISLIPDDFKRVHLPDHIFFAYYLLRPFSYLYRRLTPEKRSTLK